MRVKYTIAMYSFQLHNVLLLIYLVDNEDTWYGQSVHFVYSQPAPTGQPNTVVYTQLPQYGAPITGQPVMAQAPYGQQIVMQNQYGQPMIVQGGMQPVGVMYSRQKQYLNVKIMFSYPINASKIHHSHVQLPTS
jgi:hypothetical protein